MVFDSQLYMHDSYLKEWDAVVASVKDGKFVILDKTAFYPKSGGQPYDTGVMICDGKEYKVVYAGKFGGKISHEIDKPGLKQGDKVHCKIDWDRRYKLMRMHTAAHVLSRVIYEDTGANTSGNQLGLDKSRIDFTLDNFDRERIPGWFKKSNEIIQKDLEVKKSIMTRDEAMKIPDFAGPSPHLVKGFDNLRVVQVGDFDAQPCGGTHLDHLGEIGKLVYEGAKNKGKDNRRIYYSVE